MVRLNTPRVPDMVSHFILIALIGAINCSNSSEFVTTQRSILNELLQNGYDINEAPGTHSSTNVTIQEGTSVSVQLYINSFGSLDAAHMDYKLDLFLRQRWTDRRLAFSNEQLKQMTILDEAMLKKIWKPDTFFENVKEASIHVVTVPNVLFRISQNGDVLYSIRLRSKFSCYMDFSKYPMDAQFCYVKASSYANTNDVIKYHWSDDNPISMSEDIEIAQFDLLKVNTTEKTYKYKTGNFSGLHVIFKLRRQNGYHILQTYIPTILIVSISWVSFWLDPTAIPGRVTLGVTTLLTLTTLAAGVRQQLPPVSYVKAIDIWVGMCMIMVFGALLEFTFVNWLANRKIPPNAKPCRVPKCLLLCSVSDDDEAEGKEMGGISNQGQRARRPSTYIEHARTLDRICRISFPSGFLAFNLYYWFYFLSHQYYDD